MPPAKIRVAVNGYGVIGKRIADAVALQDDMTLAGVADISADWRPRAATRKGFKLFGAVAEHASAMRQAGITVVGTLDDLLSEADVVIDCTPKRVAAKNVETYRGLGRKFILQGGEKHAVTGHSFVAEANYASAVGRDATRVVSCNTTSLKAIAVMDPLAFLFDAKGLSSVRIPVLLLRPENDDYLSSKGNALALAAALPNAPQQIVMPGGHFIFIDPCPAEVAEVAIAQCKDAPDVDRTAVHRQIESAISEFLRKNL